MSRVYNCSMMYQHLEEILQADVQYADFTTQVGVNMIDMQALAVSLSGSITGSDLGLSFGEAMWFIAMIVTTVKDDDNFGPARYIHSAPDANGEFGLSITDSILFNVEFRGLDQQDRTVAGGMRISGVPQDGVDCNTLNSNLVSQLQDEIDVAWPPTLQVLGTPFQRVVISKRKGELPQIVQVPGTLVSNRVGIDIVRRGNKTPYKITPGQVPAPP